MINKEDCNKHVQQNIKGMNTGKGDNWMPDIFELKKKYVFFFFKLNLNTQIPIII